jgi:hypothetical protein
MFLSGGSYKIFFSSIVCVLFFSLILLTIGLQIKKRIQDVKIQKLRKANG